MEFTNTEKKLLNEDIVVFEQEIGLQLPEAFKLHILDKNGGVPKKRYFDDTRISRFLSIKYGNNTIEKLYNNIKDVVPNGFLPFAEGSGFEFYLSLADEGYGKVYLWFHDEEDSEELLANSFEEFIQALNDE